MEMTIQELIKIIHKNLEPGASKNEYEIFEEKVLKELKKEGISNETKSFQLSSK